MPVEWQILHELIERAAKANYVSTIYSPNLWQPAIRQTPDQ